MGTFDPISSAASAVTGAAETWYANRSAENRMHQQMDFSAQQYATRYQTQVKDLMAAGLNPMLAYMQSPGSAPQGTAAPVVKPEINRAINERAVAKEQSKLLEAQTANTYQTAAMNAEMERKIRQEVANAKQQYENLRAQWMKDTSDQMLKDQMNSSEQWYQRMLEAQIRLIQNQIAISDPAARAALTTGAFAAHGENISRGLSPVSDLFRLNMFRGKFKYPKRVKED